MYEWYWYEEKRFWDEICALLESVHHLKEVEHNNWFSNLRAPENNEDFVNRLFWIRCDFGDERFEGVADFLCEYDGTVIDYDILEYREM